MYLLSTQMKANSSYFIRIFMLIKDKNKLIFTLYLFRFQFYIRHFDSIFVEKNDKKDE